jgi:hypothetical protein
MEHLIYLANQLRLNRISIEQFRLHAIKYFDSMSTDDLLSIGLALNDIDEDMDTDNVVELGSKRN